MEWLPIIITMLTALLTGGSVAAYLDYRAKKLALRTEAEKQIVDSELQTLEAKLKRRQFDVDAWCKLIEQQSIRIDTLTTRVNLLEAKVTARDIRIDELEIEIDELRAWIQEQGLKPPPRHRKRNPVG